MGKFTELLATVEASLVAVKPVDMATGKKFTATDFQAIIGGIADVGDALSAKKSQAYRMALEAKLVGAKWSKEAWLSIYFTETTTWLKTVFPVTDSMEPGMKKDIGRLVHACATGIKREFFVLHGLKEAKKPKSEFEKLTIKLRQLSKQGVKINAADLAVLERIATDYKVKK